MASIYSSQPLPTGKFRILTLHPGRLSQPVVCDLVEASIDDPPEFEALSYTWGDPNITVSIQLCGQAIPVTVNLASALRYLRHEQRSRILWADAICINQSSLSERNYQVAQMSRIYKQASQVLVWLGDGSAAKNLAIDAMELIAINPSMHWYAYQHEGEDSLEARDRRFSKISHVEALQDILSAAWWKRVWTFQEAVLARNLVFHIGGGFVTMDILQKVTESYSLHAMESDCCEGVRGGASWNGRLQSGFSNVLELNMAIQQRKARILREENIRLVETHNNLVENRLKLEFEFEQKRVGFLEMRDLLPDTRPAASRDEDMLRSNAPSILNNVGKREKRSQSTIESRQPWCDFLEMMHKARSRQCSDSRDRVYGYYGLGSNLSISVLLPDYASPPHKVYMDFELQAIQRSHSLDILSLLNPWLNARTEITWLVNWNIYSYDMHMVIYNRFLCLPCFEASMGIYKDVQFVHPRSLSVRGFRFDIIESLGEPHIIPSPPWRNYENWWRMLCLDKSPLCPYIDGGLRSDAFFQTLLGYSGTTEEETQEKAAVMQSLFQRKLKNQNESDIGSSKAPEAERSILGDAIGGTWFRQMIMSKRGYIGLTNVGVEKGDLICILYGSRMPFILREDSGVQENGIDISSSAYRVVGDAYIHGIMQGQGLEILEKQGAVEAEFVLI